jgi:hypothetical protein
MQVVKLRSKLNSVIQEYVDLFCEKHDMKFDYWVAGQTGTICQLGDYFFDFQDIRFDLESKQKSENILDWYDYSIEGNYKTENYRNWCKINN